MKKVTANHKTQKRLWEDYGRLWETVKTYGKILQKMLSYK